MEECKGYFRQGVEILKLNVQAAENVAKDPKATNYALLYVALAGVASAIGTLNPFGIIVMPIFMLIAFFISIGILHLFAKLFGGQASFTEYYRAIGVGYVGTWIAVIPILGPLLSGLVSLWYIVVNVVVLKAVHKLTTFKAVLVLLLPAIVFGVIAFVLAATFAAMFAGMMAGGMGTFG